MSVFCLRSNALPWARAGAELRAHAIVLTLTLLATMNWSAHAEPSRPLADTGYLLRTWGTEDGLPENSATAIVQTQDGYLWFGTFNGLVRFNGVSFKVFNPANTPQLPSAGIVNLHADKRDRLWVSTDAGLVVKDGTQWRALGTNEGWAGDYVRTFTERANGDLLITTFDGHVLAFENGRIFALPLPGGERGQGYLGTVDENGRWWVVQNHFIGRWDGQRWMEMFSPGLSVGRSDVASTPARSGGVWVLLTKELLKLRQGSEISRLALPQLKGGLWSLCEDSRSNLWISSYDSGLYRLSPGGDLSHWTTTNGLGSLSMRGVFEDREGNLWIGSGGGGLTRFTERRFSEVGSGTALPGRAIRSVAVAGDGGLYLATYDAGLLRRDDAGLSWLPAPSATNRSAYGLSVLEDRAGRLWYGDVDGCWWRTGLESFNKVPTKWAGIAEVAALFEDSIGRVWIGGRQGAMLYDGTAFQQIKPEAGLPAGAISAFGEDSSGRVWLAGSAGVYRGEQERFVQVSGADGSPLRGVLCLKGDTGGSMWMGRRGAGVLRWRNGRADRVTVEHGLPDQEIHGFLDDGLGYFWMPSNRGIIRASRKELHAVADGTVSRLVVQNLDQNDGLPSADCFTGQPNCARDRTGRLWFATQKGVAVIDPARFRLNSQPPPVRVEQLTYHVPRPGHGQKEREAPGASGRDEVRLTAPFPVPLRLPPGSYGLEIEYAALTFSAPEKIRYELKLEGHGLFWEDVRNRHVVSFHQMQPGDYLFRVRAANSDGVWNETGASLAFSVLPFFWQTLWFRGAMGLLLAAVGGGAVFWHGRAKRRLELAEMERQRKELAERQRADEKFRLAVEASLNGIVLVNREGRMVLVNAHAESMFGYARGELIGQAVEMLVPERFRGDHPGHRTGFFAKPQSLALGVGRELFARRKDGTVFPVEIGLSPIETSEETLVLAAIVDITFRKQSEQELAQQRNQLTHLSRVNMLGELAGSLAHELNQPLTAVLSNAQAAQRFLAQDQPDLNEVKDILTDIVAEDKRAGEVIHRLRLLLKKGEVQHQPLDVNEVVQDVLKLVHSDLVNQNFTAHTELASDLPVLHGDRVQLQQVLLNLVMNACDAMANAARDYRQLTIRTRRADDGSVCMSVVDCGAGIAPEKLDQVFEPFYTTKPHGMGLGLTVCRTIVAAHGGKLWATNNLERGATFHVSLPVAKPKQI